MMIQRTSKQHHRRSHIWSNTNRIVCIYSARGAYINIKSETFTEFKLEPSTLSKVKHRSESWRAQRRYENLYELHRQFGWAAKSAKVSFRFEQNQADFSAPSQLCEVNTLERTCDYAAQFIENFDQIFFSFVIRIQYVRKFIRLKKSIRSTSKINQFQIEIREYISIISFRSKSK